MASAIVPSFLLQHFWTNSRILFFQKPLICSFAVSVPANLVLQSHFLPEKVEASCGILMCPKALPHMIPDSWYWSFSRDSFVVSTQSQPRSSRIFVIPESTLFNSFNEEEYMLRGYLNRMLELVRNKHSVLKLNDIHLIKQR